MKARLYAIFYAIVLGIVCAAQWKLHMLAPALPELCHEARAARRGVGHFACRVR